MAEAPDCTPETLEVDFEAAPAGTVISDSTAKMGSPVAESDQVEGSLNSDLKKKKGDFRAEIDTAAPFESVKEAATRFGGFGFWKPNHRKLPEAEQHDMEEFDFTKVEEQAAQLENDLIVKEREALEVLKELEATKVTVEELKLKLQKAMSEVDATTGRSSDDKLDGTKEGEKEKHENAEGGREDPSGCMGQIPPSTPGLILMELKQAKLNLTRTTNDLAEIRASVESYNKKLEKERISLEKTRERLISSSTKVSCLEEQLNRTRTKLQVAKDAKINNTISDSPMDISRELRRLSSEVEKYKKLGEVAKSEVSRTISEMEQTRTKIKTAEIRLLSAKRMKEAARAAEVVALAEIKALSNSEISPGVTLSFEEYSSLTAKARESEEKSKKRVLDAMLEVDEANISKMEILKRVEDATEEVKTSRKALEEALSRVEAANRGKLSVEEALRKWRSEHGQRRRSMHNSTKFKTPHQCHRRRDSRLFDVNEINAGSEEAVPVLQPTLSIGEILSRKLLLAEEFGRAGKSIGKRKVSLGQMLNKNSGELPASQRDVGGSSHRQFPAKRKKFGLAKLSTILTKQSKKKKPTPNLNLK